MRQKYDKLPNKSQKQKYSKSTGLKGQTVLTRQQHYDGLQQISPDGAHAIQDLVHHLMDLITGKTDSEKLRNAEKLFGRFNNTWIDNTKEPPAKRRKLAQPQSPWTLSTSNLKKADIRAMSLLVPHGWDLKPGPLFSKPHLLKKMHSKAQFVKEHILIYCIRALIGNIQIDTLKQLFNCIDEMTAASVPKDSWSQLAEKTSEALCMLEQDWPLSLQNITTHIFHHMVMDLERSGPMYARWTYPFERVQCWVAHQALNKQHQEATIMEAYAVYDWVSNMALSGQAAKVTKKVPSETPKTMTEYMSMSPSTDKCRTLSLLK
ncbi:unnamed protein product [Owenia fusiformis]|uniref:DUF4218 domain-containing protein n=1 Tax=Owenia fusiformis TaxID=6347 RepID=A0A8S4P8W8_OWEFU|nr:unnamed protein product [Owenia fusiformis]